GAPPAPRADRRVMAGAAVGGAGPERGLDGVLSPQTRKPLVEKKRRARINESLRELAACVLERTVRRVRAVLERRARGGRRLLEASERFAAGYIQCMHEVHTFVSAARHRRHHGRELLTPAGVHALNEGGCPDSLTDAWGARLGPWPAGEVLALTAGARPGLALPAPGLSPSPSEETCSDSDEAEAEPGQTSTDGLDASQTQGLASPGSPKSMWRPW
uniref:Hes family bHLH transcription factor 6 n=1 Tax=Malurus cyaneus samueli TaxID=2593467 RepID=A0A8C5TN04_9PASS